MCKKGGPIKQQAKYSTNNQTLKGFLASSKTHLLIYLRRSERMTNPLLETLINNFSQKGNKFKTFPITSTLN